MEITMGEIIKSLRKKQGLTQEALAELLQLTPQAISKWENNTGMPDIAQIVPLANIFGVHTDVLFGLTETNDEDAIEKMIENIIAELTYPKTTEKYLQCYEKLTEALKRFPNNPALLIHALEFGITLAFPENDVYDETNAERIYKECIRYANILTTISSNPTHSLRAHMIMVLLHSSHGNKEDALRHAKNFPWRADMTVHAMEAIISHFDKRYQNEQFFRQRDFSFHMEAVLNDLVQYARAFRAEQKYDEALYIYEKMLSLIDWLCAEEEVVPSLHCREWGDIHVHMATLYMKKEMPEKAIECLTKMTDYDIHMRERFISPLESKSYLFQGASFPCYYRKNARKEILLSKLQAPAFSPLKDHEQYRKLLERANGL